MTFITKKKMFIVCDVSCSMFYILPSKARQEGSALGATIYGLVNKINISNVKMILYLFNAKNRSGMTTI